MKAFARSGPISLHLWLLGALGLLFLPSCATNRMPDGRTTSSPEDIDIGYGSVERDHLVGSVSTLEGEDLRDVGVRTLADMLVRVPGVQVIEKGGLLSVRIRGTNSSFLASQEPLFVIDGMMLPAGLGGLSHMNPNAIASIAVLKDAGATAVYGSRGANGVILIRTKSGS